MNRGTTAGIFTEDGYMNFRSEDLGLKSVFRNYSDYRIGDIGLRVGVRNWQLFRSFWKISRSEPRLVRLVLISD